MSVYGQRARVALGVRQLEEAVDVAARTDDSCAGKLLGILLKHVTHGVAFFLSDSSGKHAQSAHVERVALGEYAVVQQGDFGGTSTYVYIGEVAFGAGGVLYEVVAQQLRLLGSWYNLQTDARGLLDASHHLRTVLGVAHCRRGAGAEVLHIVQLHKLIESLHHVHHHALSLLRYLAERKNVLAQSQWDANEEQFADTRRLGCVVVETLYEQSGSVGAYVYSGNVHSK